MPKTLTRRALGAAAMSVPLAAPFVSRAEAAAPLLLRCSLESDPSHPRNIALRGLLAEIEKASDGRVKTRLFESGVLYPDLHVVKAVVQGQVEMACPGTWTITGFVPDADFSELPAFYGRTIADVHKATDGVAGTFINAEVTRKLKVQVLGGWLDLGFNNWYATHKKLTSLESLRDMKLRSPGGVLNSWRIRFMGGIPVVTPWPEVPLAMSQGNFDGLITSNESANSSKLFDSGMRYSLQDDQAMALYVPIMNGPFWKRLGPKLQQTILQLWHEHLPAYRALAGHSQQAARGALARQGVGFVDVSQAERDAVRAKMMPLQAKAAASAHMSPALVKQVMTAIGA